MRIAMLGVKAVPCIGGIQLYAEEAGRRLVERGHQVTVYCRQQYLDGDLAPEYRGIRRRITAGFRGKHLDAPTHTLTAACDVLRRDYDIAHFHGVGPSAFASLLRLRPKTRTVVTMHGLDWQRAKWGWFATACLRTAARFGPGVADQITCVSRSDARFFEARLDRQVVHTPCAITEQPLAAPDEIRAYGLEGDDYILFVSRLVPEKGCHYLLEAYQRLKPDRKLVIAGGSNYADPYAESLKQQANENVIFTGYVRGKLLRELYSNAYLFVQPSDLEGMPFSLLEALSYGRCVLASDIPGNLEAIGGQGFTFQAGDVDELSAKLRSLLDSPDVVTAQRDSALEYVRRERTWDKTVDALESVYERALNGRRG